MPLSSSYSPSEFEPLMYELWSQHGVGTPEKQLSAQNLVTAPTYTILMPPPNLTGTLHAGHAFQHYLMDTLSRKARLEGKRTLWYPGTDHAGIQLEGVIDKLIAQGEFDDTLNSAIPEHIQSTDKANWLKDNNRELWLQCAWSKVNQWRDHQRDQSAILGDTPDYTRSLFTLDERATRMVMTAFEKYWQDGLIYKGEYMINWSVGLQTALSDFQQDVEWVEQQDPFITFVYSLQSISNTSSLLSEEDIAGIAQALEEIPVSTVRPETIFGDVAVAIHSKTVITLLSQVFEPQSQIIAHTLQALHTGELRIMLEIDALSVDNVQLVISDKVDPEFGSGTLKVTPAHDQFDYDLYKECVDNKILPEGFNQAIGRDGKLTDITHEFEGLTVLQGRMLVIKRLLESGFILTNEDEEDVLPEEYTSDEAFLELSYQAQIQLLKQQYPHHAVDWSYTHNVLYCERSKTPIEPLISSEYFLSYHLPSKELGKNLQTIGLEGIAQTQFYPDELKQRTINILDTVHDWCISRKLVWGHRIPVWYNELYNPNHTFISANDIHKEFPILQANGSTHIVKGDQLMQVSSHKPTSAGDWVQETKVFDTWFSSCLWPLTTLDFFDTLAGKENTDFDTYYNTDVLVTGGDILYAWIVRMIVLCTYWTGKTPFKQLVVTPTILDEKGKKMSKSLGNGLQPEVAISKYSSDALRLGMLGGMIPGRNMRMGGSIADSLCEKYRNFGNKIWNVARFLEYSETQLQESRSNN